ncbi:MAG TPA: iron uptake transporter deferrochelatase/peroxidase subunit [Alphaproteobacteria bacterium]|nr:iron uptake transporter deferrochelatase/peroxidase subunit [Alphaproteobacteria bacterium]
MNPSDEKKTSLSRRRFLGCGFMAAASAGLSAQGAPAIVAAIKNDEAEQKQAIEPFYGEHQGGIATLLQRNTYFAAFDLVTTERDDVVKMLQDWTAAAARMTSGKTAMPLGKDDSVPASDSGEALGLSPARLTITFGFGAGLFIKDGKDRYGLANLRPAALVDLPKFAGDQLVESRTGGDLSVQACADDPQVAFHAVRELARLAYNVAQIRWVQTGFVANFNAKETPRNLMGFKDGTVNPSVSDSKTMDQVVWVGNEGPDWMRGGSYVVVRRIRIALEHWDRMKLMFQEQTIGRHKYSGAPLGKTNEFDKADYDAEDADGNPVIPENAHIRLAAAVNNDGAQILRRPYSYNDGANVTAERWPPWRDEMEFDAGLFFVCYQRDPRTGFIKLFEKMSKFDMMNQFVTHVGSGLFVCPGGVKTGEFIGQQLFKA